ncbi:MAG: tetratricopeptide repeat protein [Bacteroidetes bacterium]|nr:tetratricopeptide repeat protein [Bacteroidota bacterium]MBU2585326.1 tetratricopeptide repeat protein [Bacteroidota bacterium]
MTRIRRIYTDIILRKENLLRFLKCRYFKLLNKSSKVLFLLIVISIPTETAFSQGIDDMNKFRLAQSYESIGNHEKALDFYRELYQKDPNQYQYYEAFLRSLNQLKKYDEVVGILKRRLQIYPNDFNLYGEIAVIYSRKEMEDSLNYFVKKGIELDPKNPMSYKFISNALIQNRLFKKAIDVLERGKRATNDNLMFSIDLISVYALLMNYRSASIEMVELLKVDQNQSGFIQSKLASILNKPDALKTSIQIFETAPKDNLASMRILSWLYFQAKDFTKAFDIALKIDRLSNSKGYEILSFADRAYREKELTQAINAYEFLLKEFPEEKDLRAFSIIGLARSYEEKFLLEVNNISTAWKKYRLPLKAENPTAKSAVNYYNIIIKDFPNSNLIAEALFKIGKIKLEYFFDLQSAEQLLKQVVDYYPLSEFYGKVLLLLAELEKVKENYVQAENYFTQVRISPRVSENERYYSDYKISELLLLRGLQDSAKNKLMQLSKNNLLDVTNDVLELLILIQENPARRVELNEAGGEDNDNVKSFLNAQQLIDQKKFVEAIELFNKLSKGDDALSITNLARIEIAEIYILLDNYSNALAQLVYITDQKDKTIYGDKALFRQAEIYLFGIKDPIKANQLLEKLLVDYPQSLLITESRKIINKIKENNL